ncbi:toll/interleukin-1 receptor domain-containing protein [Pseudofrankia inefficax]|uniref:TIR domain-containing protein n=1 Tax=Pseudofrankia inefficax (strain DSM 45817 / CECT 9037 / DDB 130130 / EuI1c) TaxID=298654 RepID=E3JB73_PSEI1|nr:toll/interleukin-1 receptor domain-containing protein [Pseudofrankia inefficax]ADP78603.1 hypothetical protein FraEuI1c_0521 [Pseudofrankia inefficax]
MTQQLSDLELRTLAEVYFDRWAGGELLKRAGLSPADQPQGAGIVLDFWRQVNASLGAGILADGRRRILAAAAADYPANEVFRRGLSDAATSGRPGGDPATPVSRGDLASEPDEAGGAGATLRAARMEFKVSGGNVNFGHQGRVVGSSAPVSSREGLDARARSQRHPDSGSPDRTAPDVLVLADAEDESWGQWVAWHLHADGYRVELDDWSQYLADQAGLLLADAVRATSLTILVRGHGDPVWSASYFQLAGFQELAVKKRGRIVGVRVSAHAADVVPMDGVTFVDLVGLGENESAARLTAAVRRLLTGWEPTAVKPAFPGDGP